MQTVELNRGLINTPKTLRRLPVSRGLRSPLTGFEVEFHNSLDGLENAWIELEQHSNSSPFQRFSWIKTLYSYCQSSSQSGLFGKCRPLIVAGRVHGRLVFALPLVLETNVFGNHLKWVGENVSDYNGMILDRTFAQQIRPGFFNQLVEILRSEIPNLDSVYLTRNSGAYDALEWLFADGVNQWPSEYGSHVLKLSRNWKSVFERVRSKKSRSRLRSKTRSFGMLGEISFRQIRNQNLKVEYTNQILDWKTVQLRRNGSRNPFGNETSPSITRDAICSSVNDSAKDSLNVFGLFCNGRMVAGMLAFVANQNFYYLVSAYSPDVPGKYSVGTQLLVKTLELASRSGLNQYDFLLGDEPYKYQWCDHSLPMTNHMVPLSWRGSLYGVYVRSRQEIKTGVMNSPFLSGLVKKFLRANVDAASINFNGETVSVKAGAVNAVNPTVFKDRCNDHPHVMMSREN